MGASNDLTAHLYTLPFYIYLGGMDNLDDFTKLNGLVGNMEGVE